MRHTAGVALLFCLATATLAATTVKVPGWLGLAYTLQKDPAGDIKQWLFLRAVHETSPAHAAGMAANDLIVAINGKLIAFANNAEMVRYFSGVRPGTQIRFTVVRDDHRRQFTVTAATMPPELARRWLQNAALAEKLDDEKERH
jgi:C-terminal processing protease CtpA/Prc